MTHLIVLLALLSSIVVAVAMAPLWQDQAGMSVPVMPDCGTVGEHDCPAPRPAPYAFEFGK